MTLEDPVLDLDLLIDGILDLPDPDAEAVDPLLLVDQAPFDLLALFPVFEAILNH